MADEQDNSTSTPITGQAKQQAQQVVQQGRQTAGHLWELGRAQFHTQLTGQKERAATGLDDFSQLIRQTGTQLKEQGHTGSSGYADQIADKISTVAASVHEKEIEELVTETEQFARRSPALFLSIAALLGFMLTRFLKSSSPAASTTA